MLWRPCRLSSARLAACLGAKVPHGPCWAGRPYWVTMGDALVLCWVVMTRAGHGERIFEPFSTSVMKRLTKGLSPRLGTIAITLAAARRSMVSTAQSLTH